MSALIDVHCHLTGDEYDERGGASRVIEAAEKAGVKRLICSGFDLPSSQKAEELSKRFESVYFCAGFQPEELGGCDSSALDGIKALLENPKCVAVGEIGLDYHFDDNPPKERQKEIFIQQILMADEAGLPIVVHSRDACADTLEILTDYRDKIKRGGLMHCYSYSAESVREFEKLGMYFSFGGTVTFKNAKKVKESAKAVARDRILTETDSPYLTPEPLRGRFPNLPENVAHTTAYLAELLGEEKEKFEKTVLENAYRLFFKMKRN